jgi:hypothetical protein
MKRIEKTISALGEAYVFVLEFPFGNCRFETEAEG